jgi:hypothetical protein
VIAGYLGSGDGFAEALGKFGARLRRPDRKGLGSAAPLAQDGYQSLGEAEEASMNRRTFVQAVATAALSTVVAPVKAADISIESASKGRRFRCL